MKAPCYPERTLGLGGQASACPLLFYGLASFCRRSRLVWRTPEILECGPQDVLRESKSVPPPTADGIRREIAHAVLVVGRSLCGGDQRDRRVLHVDVHDRVDDLVAPRLVQARMHPFVERPGRNQGGKVLDGLDQRIDLPD